MSMSVKLPDELAARLTAEAERQGVSPDELAARVLGEHVQGRRRLSFVAMGESTSGRSATEAEDMLGEGFGR
jgi:predicted transcriptional regulator